MRHTYTLALTLLTNSLFALPADQTTQTLQQNFQSGHPSTVTTHQDKNLLWKSVPMPMMPQGMVVVQTQKAPTIWFAYPEDRYSYVNKLYRSTNSGKTWRALRLPKDAFVGTLASIDSQHLILGTNQGIYLSEDAGNHWSKANAGLPNQSMIRSISPINKHRLIALVGQDDRGDNIFRSDDDGHHWTAASFGLDTAWNLYRTVTARDNVVVMAVGDRLYNNKGGLYISHNRGESWSQPNDSWRTPYISSVAINSQHALFVVTNDLLFKTDVEGKTWTPLATTIDTKSNRATIQVDAKDRLYLHLERYPYSRIYRSEDNGQTWQLLKEFNDQTSNLNILKDGRLIVSSPYNTWISDKQQQQFNPKLFPSQNINSMATDPSNLWLLIQGQLYQRPHHEKKWIKHSYIGGSLTGLAQFKDQLVIANSDNHLFYSSKDAGKTWRQLSMNSGRDVALSTSSTHLWATHAPLEYPGKAYISTDASNWQQVPDTNIASLYVENNNMYNLQYQQLKKSTDNGLTWNVLLNLQLGSDTPVVLTAYANQYLLLAIDAAGIVASSDGGVHWHIINQGLGVWHFTSLLMLDETNYLVGTAQGVYITHDAGQHWLLANRGLAHLYINRLYRDQNTVYAATASGLYQTTI